MTIPDLPNGPGGNDPARPGLMARLVDRWRALNDWIKALLIAFLVLAFVHVFVLRWVTVRSTSMYATLWPGDLVGVTQWERWTGFTSGDVIVFRDPLQDDRTMPQRQLLVKRIVGMPGDVVELRKGELLVNNEPVPEHPGETRSWLVHLKKGADPAPLVADLGLPAPGRSLDGQDLELPLNDTLATGLRDRPEVKGVEPMRTARGAPGHIFPYSPLYRWNSDDYGPIIVPRKGDKVRVDLRTLPLYDRIISRYEGNKLEAVKRTLTINGEEANDYAFRQDYYFVLGDSRHHSADSRYWGFVPADHVVGRAAFVLLSSEAENGDLRPGRWFKSVP